MITSLLEDSGYVVQAAGSAEEARRLLPLTDFDVVLTDIGLPHSTGIDLLTDIFRIIPDATVVMLTGEPTVATATQAMQGGAFDYLLKPISAHDMLRAIARAAAIKELKDHKRRLERENDAYQQHLEKMVEERTVALRTTEAHLSDILRVAPVGIYLSHCGKITEANPALCDLLGYAQIDLLGQPERIIHRSDGDCAAAHGDLRKEIGVSGIARLAFVLRHRDGSDRQVQMHAAAMGAYPVIDSPITIVVLDVTERMKLQAERDQAAAELRQSQKMDALGRLAAGIAHEINTPSQFVMDNISFLRDSMADMQKLLAVDRDLRAAAVVRADPQGVIAEAVAKDIDIDFLTGEIPKSIAQAMEGMERIRTIVVAMKEFSHPATGTFLSADLNHLIESTLTISRNEWKYLATMELALDPELPPVQCMPGEVSQVLLNLVVNACHAIADAIEPGSGRLGVIAISSSRDGDWAEIRLKDSGAGIPPEIRERIFEPFFTTKGIGKGTGQGLALAWSVIVDKHHGILDFTSAPGKGTTFLIRLPIVNNRH
jgi:PAS domain S-box-containing protein